MLVKNAPIGEKCLLLRNYGKGWSEFKQCIKTSSTPDAYFEIKLKW